MITGKHFIGSGEPSARAESETFHAVAPDTGATLLPAFHEASDEDVDEAVRLAEAAAVEMRGYTGDRLGELCDAIAGKLESMKVALLDRTALETGYPKERLLGEFTRTVWQLRAFGEVARKGTWRDPRVDLAEPSRAPLPKPDVRSLRFPLGPVAIFGASNFPLALSCAGGDTASALAAGCPVVMRGHPSHPGACELAAQAILEAVREVGFPQGTFSLLQGRDHEVGAALVRHPGVRAVGFTGSLRGGRALFDEAAARPVPIPVYAEMGSVNPQFVFASLLEHDAEGFAQRLFESVIMGNGQFCTNPGLVFVPAGRGADRFLKAYEALVMKASAEPLLNEGIQQAYLDGVELLKSLLGVDGCGGEELGEGFRARPALITTSLDVFRRNRDVFEGEVFGPVTVVVICPNSAAYEMLADRFPGQLGCSLHGTEEELAGESALMMAVTRFAGRVCVNQFPTGIEICEAMHHGGLYPAATDPHFTSIGLRSIERWGRRVSFQNVPSVLLPEALR